MPGAGLEPASFRVCRSGFIILLGYASLTVLPVEPPRHMAGYRTAMRRPATSGFHGWELPNARQMWESNPRPPRIRHGAGPGNRTLAAYRSCGLRSSSSGMVPVYFRLSAGVLILSGVRNRSRCPATVVLAHYAIRSLAGMGSAARYSTGLTCGQCAAVSFYAQYIGVAGLAPDRGIEPLRRSGSLLALVLVRHNAGLFPAVSH